MTINERMEIIQKRLRKFFPSAYISVLGNPCCPCIASCKIEFEVNVNYFIDFDNIEEVVDKQLLNLLERRHNE